jgi:hypothetical protein
MQVFEQEDMCKSEGRNDEGNDHSRIDVVLDLIHTVIGIARSVTKGLDDVKEEGRNQLQPNQIEK